MPASKDQTKAHGRQHTTSAAEAATSAAAGCHAQPHRLDVGIERAHYPSEYQTPRSATANQSRIGEDRGTGRAGPIAAPAAYTDFLRAVSPALTPTTAGSRSRDNHSTSDAGDHVEDADDQSHDSETAKDDLNATPRQPPISRNDSTESSSTFASFSSTSSTSTTVSSASDTHTPAVAGAPRTKPDSPHVTIPPSSRAGTRPSSARTPRRLYIPCSPLSGGGPRTPASARALLSARTLGSPWSASVGSPLVTSATVSSRSPHDAEHTFVREVVTRTITYVRTVPAPLGAAPRGKRRRTNAGEDGGSGTASGTPSVEEKRGEGEGREGEDVKPEEARG